MCPKVPTVLALIGALLVCEVVLESYTDPVQAKEYYTRKRVNGVWITGYFERKESRQTGKDQFRPADKSANTPGLDTSGASAAEANTPPVQRAAEARHTAIAAAFAEANPPEPGLLPLQRALEERARMMAMAEPDSPIQLRAVRSITLDFESRTKTSQFVDGSRKEEPFEPAVTGGVDASAFP